MTHPYRSTILKNPPSTHEEDALKALDEEYLVRNTPEGRARRANLFEQERVILSVILSGDEAMIRKLDQAFVDPELDPAVRDLIDLCWAKSRCYRRQINDTVMPNSGNFD
jgi:hypothetical protein